MELLFFWILCGVAAAVVASAKNRSGFGWFLMGAVFGPFGLFMIAFMPSIAPNSDKFTFSKRCPFCAEDIKPQALICRYCGKEQPSAPPAKPKIKPAPVAPKSRYCHHCGTDASLDADACPSCTRILPDSPVFCPKCGHEVTHRPETCPGCGTKFKYKASE